MSSSLPKISVITPSFNQGKYLEATILSVIGQGYPNLEYIIIDGGSTDDSLAIIKKYEQHLAYWTSEKDNGLYHALQKGFARSTGEIMSWINSDDMYHKKCLFTVATIFERFRQVRWIMGSNTFFDEGGQPFVYEEEPYQQRWSKWRLYFYRGKFIQQESVFWKRTLWDEAGGFINLDSSLAADFELWLRFFRHDSLYTTSFLLGGFRLRNENQKSLEQRKAYLDEVHALLKQEQRQKGDGGYLAYCRLMLVLTNVLPKKWRERTLLKVLKLPKKIVFDRAQGFAFSKR